jgi:purine-nucleoside/S-methyl-5'-thioadenosine phosphorylase / adenosine deaminase
MADLTPPVASRFVWRQTPAGRALISPDLGDLAAHLFTTRDLQFPEGPAGSDYAPVAEVLGVSQAEVVRVRQVHGQVVRVVRPGERLAPLSDGDAIVSTDPARAVAIRMADCVPILIADRHRRAVAAVHGGWRGTAAGVCGAAVAAIAEEGVPPADLVAAIGPSIGPCCYQVGEAVRAAFETAQPAGACWFRDDGPGRWRLDLWRATVDQLVRAGVPQAAIVVSRECTVDHPDRYHSFRRDGAAAGRMVAAIRLAPRS